MTSARKLGIRAKLFFAFAAVSGTTVIAGAAAWLMFSQVRDLFHGVAGRNIPEIVETLGLQTDTQALAGSAPTLLAAKSQAQRQQEMTALKARQEGIATQTARATEGITAQVTAIQGSTQEAVDTIKGIGQIIDKMSEIATTVASAVEEQGAATAEIARNIQQAASGTQNVSNNIVGVSNAANQTGETASDVLQSSDGLAAESEALSNEVGRFLARIKAA